MGWIYFVKGIIGLISYIYFVQFKCVLPQEPFPSYMWEVKLYIELKITYFTLVLPIFNKTYAFLD